MTAPQGYTALAAGWRRAVVRNDLVPALAPWLLGPVLAPPDHALPIAGGRGATFTMALDERTRGVVRLGRRGGFLGRFVRERYVGFRPRPLRELRVSLGARARGAPVPEVLAVAVHGWGIYRSAIVTLEVVGARPVLAALEAAGTGEARRAVGHLAGTAVARLHGAGVVHPDLNLSNILVSASRATIVDLDRARLIGGRAGRLRRRWGLQRLRRSVRKLDPESRLVDAEVVRAFHVAYAARPEDACAS